MLRIQPSRERLAMETLVRRDRSMNNHNSNIVNSTRNGHRRLLRSSAKSKSASWWHCFDWRRPVTSNESSHGYRYAASRVKELHYSNAAIGPLRTQVLLGCIAQKAYLILCSTLCRKFRTNRKGENVIRSYRLSKPIFLALMSALLCSRGTFRVGS